MYAFGTAHDLNEVKDLNINCEQLFVGRNAHATTITHYANPNLDLKSAIQFVQSFIVFVSTML